MKKPGGSPRNQPCPVGGRPLTLKFRSVYEKKHSLFNGQAGNLCVPGYFEINYNIKLMKTAVFQTIHRQNRSVASWLALYLCVLAAAPGFSPRGAAQPVLTNVTAVQQALPSTLVNISYTISDPSHTNAVVSILVSKDSGATWTVPASTFTGAYGSYVGVSPTPAVKSVVWNAGADWGGNYSATCRVRVQASDTDMQLIPAGYFYMGTQYPDTDGLEPLHPVTLTTAYNMEVNLVSGGQWNLVVGGYAQANGYDLVPAEQGATNGPAFKAANHPVQQVMWYDAIKWCNARSQLEGAAPVYYLDAGYTTLYKTGMNDIVYMNPAANGYRLPTECQWECAARGGPSGPADLRFPWATNPGPGYTNINITVAQANYTELYLYNQYGGSSPWYFSTYYNGSSSPSEANYDVDLPPPGLGETNSVYTYGTYNPNTAGGLPYTTPIGSYATNAIGLYDMAGNVAEWCWDWYYQYNYQYGVSQTDPTGPPFSNSEQGYTLTTRVARGGAWSQDPSNLRCACRGNYAPNTVSTSVGFRCVRGPF